MASPKPTAQIDALIGKAKAKQGGSKSGGGARKLGRSKRHPAMARYNMEMRWIRNKVKRVRRHFKEHPDDSQAEKWLTANG